MSTTPPSTPSSTGGRGRADPARGGRGRRGRLVLRLVVVSLAAVVTVLAAVPPEGTAAAPPGSGIPSPTPSPTPTPVPASEPGPDVPPAPDALPGAGPVVGPPSDTGAPVPAPVRPPGAGRRAPGADHAWPLVPVPAVVTPFRQPTFRFGRGHRGADLAGAPGQAVLATREGVVAFAGRVAGRPVVSVDHPDGLRTTYEPVLATVRAGDRVDVGDPIGVLAAGHAGCPSTCLHWGVRRGKVDYLDPLVLVRPPGLRLLPVGAG